MRISFKSKFEKEMLNSFLEWFNHSWESSVELKDGKLNVIDLL